jgi:hypothetical protein
MRAAGTAIVSPLPDPPRTTRKRTNPAKASGVGDAGSTNLTAERSVVEAEDAPEPAARRTRQARVQRAERTVRTLTILWDYGQEDGNIFFRVT